MHSSDSSASRERRDFIAGSAISKNPALTQRWPSNAELRGGREKR
jgi:hypothetical protein